MTPVRQVYAKRHTQRGNAYVVIALVIVALLALAGLVKAWQGYTDGIEKRGYSRGVDETTAMFQKRDNAALQAALREVEQLRKEKDATEARHASQLTAKENESAQKLAAKDRDYDAFIADVNAGRVLFRQPGEAGGCPADGDPRRTAEAPGDPGAGAGHLGRGVVPPQDPDAVFLLSEARRADRVLEKLRLCRGVLEVERSP